MILTLANQKGGVGKTTITYNLGHALADLGRRVLLVDLDPQMSLTLACGVDDVAGQSMAEVMGAHRPGALGLEEIILDLPGGPALAPSDILLASHEAGLWQRWGRERILANALARVSGYDMVLIDCPPNLGLLTVNALVASDRVLIPTVPDYLSLRGLILFLETLQNVREQLNPDLVALGVVLNLYDHRLIHAQDVVAAMERQGIPILPVQVRRSVRVAEAALAHEPIMTYDPINPAAEAFRELAEVVNDART